MLEDERPSRRIKLGGCFNFRDLGGYRTSDGQVVAWRRLFRSDGLNHLTEHDLEVVDGALGVRTAIDLRSHEEVARDQRYLPDGLLVHHLPMFDQTRRRERSTRKAAPSFADMGAGYLTMATGAGAVLRSVLEILADANTHPVVFACAAGKDRTGVTAAIILSLLGVPDDEIVSDYVLTNEAMGPISERLRSDPHYSDVLRDLPSIALEAPAEAMWAFLRCIRTDHGAIDAFVASIGVGGATITSLRQALLVSASAGSS